MIRVAMTVGRFKRFHGHAEIARRFELVGAPLHEPRRRRVAERVPDYLHDEVAAANDAPFAEPCIDE